ncbi:myb/SANT-like DNA-binding domain-containing protein 4 [Pecten maximus]|uniref:myb/SANT-like DNA-binding domain-containing protein 4 n=1 Tax=Pecten maximus TaxID=6579 RepID=UPI001458D269|nr:myb/SANT-like DNA-binding domain-containing protein 4 [Pecten maximus]
MACKMTRKRKPNFTTNELEVLLKGVSANRDILMGKFSDTVTNDRKKKIWKTIAAEVSAESSTQRSDEDVKKKWQDWSSVVKGKQAKATRERKKTGGGPPHDDDDDVSLSVMEERVLGILGTTCVYGIEADFGDTFVNTDSQSNRNIRSLECDEDLDELESNDSVQIHVHDDEEDNTTSIAVSPTCGKSTQNKLTPRPSCSRSRPSEVCNETSLSCFSVKKRKRVTVPLPDNSMPSTHDIYQVENRKLAVEETRLTIERDRLDIEKQRLNIETEILMVLKEFHPTSSRHSQNPTSTFPYVHVPTDEYTCTFANI